jgi:hypothetical protein
MHIVILFFWKLIEKLIRISSTNFGGKKNQQTEFNLTKTLKESFFRNIFFCPVSEWVFSCSEDGISWVLIGTHFQHFQHFQLERKKKLENCSPHIIQIFCVRHTIALKNQDQMKGLKKKKKVKSKKNILVGNHSP